MNHSPTLHWYPLQRLLCVIRHKKQLLTLPQTSTLLLLQIYILMISHTSITNLSNHVLVMNNHHLPFDRRNLTIYLRHITVILFNLHLACRHLIIFHYLPHLHVGHHPQYTTSNLNHLLRINPYHSYILELLSINHLTLCALTLLPMMSLTTTLNPVITPTTVMDPSLIFSPILASNTIPIPSLSNITRLNLMIKCLTISLTLKPLSRLFRLDPSFQYHLYVKTLILHLQAIPPTILATQTRYSRSQYKSPRCGSFYSTKIQFDQTSSRWHHPSHDRS